MSYFSDIFFILFFSMFVFRSACRKKRGGNIAEMRKKRLENRNNLNFSDLDSLLCRQWDLNPRPTHSEASDETPQAETTHSKVSVTISGTLSKPQPQQQQNLLEQAQHLTATKTKPALQRNTRPNKNI